jgi:hypothetical protein
MPTVAEWLATWRTIPAELAVSHRGWVRRRRRGGYLRAQGATGLADPAVTPLSTMAYNFVP